MPVSAFPVLMGTDWAVSVSVFVGDWQANAIASIRQRGHARYVNNRTRLFRVITKLMTSKGSKKDKGTGNGY